MRYLLVIFVFLPMNPFFDRRLFINLGLTLLSSALILLCIKITPAIHLPYFVATALATGLGFLESRKGWFLALVQAITIWVLYTGFFPTTDGPADRDLEMFGLYGSMILSFVGSFIGALLKRGLDRG